MVFANVSQEIGEESANRVASLFMILLKNHVHPSIKLRANGNRIDKIENFPFMLSLSKRS